MNVFEMSTQPKQYILNCPDNCRKNNSFHRMVYYEWGDKSSKKVAICVHGLARMGRDFDYLARSLAESGYCVICPDIVGRGRSDWLIKPKYYGYPLYIADLLGLLRHLRVSKIDWIGTSMGGFIGMMIAADFPNLINRLILNDIGPFIPKESLMRIGKCIGQNHSFGSYESAEIYLKKVMTSFGIKKQGHWDHIVKHTLIPGPNGSCQFAYDPQIGLAFWNMRGKQRKMPDMDIWKIWDKIQCQMLILRGGESDLLLKETADQMLKNNNVEAVIEFEEIGHAPSLMEKDQISAVTNWLC